MNDISMKEAKNLFKVFEDRYFSVNLNFITIIDTLERFVDLVCTDCDICRERELLDVYEYLLVEEIKKSLSRLDPESAEQLKKELLNDLELFLI